MPELLTVRLRFHGRYAAETQDECAARKNREREEAADAIERAPDLLAGCKAALEMVDGNGAPPDWDWLRKIVAKAEGRALPE